MKTYKTIIEKPRLEIRIDGDCESPREWSNLGYFITIDRDYKSPDNKKEFISIIEETSNEAQNQKEHIKLIKKAIEKELGEKVLAIYPVVKYEHSGISYSLGTKQGFDYSNNGFYIITEKTQKEVGTKKKDWEKVIQGELEIYNQWVNGEVYGFILYDEQGEYLDGCGGFYSIDEIKNYLPEDWKNENLEDYLI